MSPTSIQMSSCKMNSWLSGKGDKGNALFMGFNLFLHCANAVADPEGAQKAVFLVVFFVSHSLSECLKSKTQIARESIKNPRASRAFKQALDPSRNALWASRSWYECAHIIVCALQMKILDPPLQWNLSIKIRSQILSQISRFYGVPVQFTSCGIQHRDSSVQLHHGCMAYTKL